MKKRVLALLFGSLLFVALIAGCSNQSTSGGAADTNDESAQVSDSENTDSAQSEEAEAADYKFGTVDIPALDGSLCGAPIYIAYEKGFFADEGIDANLTAADFETRKIGLNNGNVPFVNGDFQFFSSAEQGISMKVIGGMHKGCIKLVVRSDSDIESPEDLIGKNIGVDEVGGTTFQVASVWLEEGGVSARQEDGEVTFLPYSDGNLELQALYDGDIDIAAVWDPLGDIAVASGQAKVLIDISKDEPFAGKSCCFYYASEKVLNENPDLIKALYEAVQNAQEWIDENPEEAVEIISSENYSEIEDAELAAELITHYEYETHEHKSDVREDIRYFAEELNKIGYLETDADTFTDNIYYAID